MALAAVKLTFSTLQSAGDSRNRAVADVKLTFLNIAPFTMFRIVAAAAAKLTFYAFNQPSSSQDRHLGKGRPPLMARARVRSLDN